MQLKSDWLADVQPLQYHNQPGCDCRSLPCRQPLRRKPRADAERLSWLPAPMIRNANSGTELAMMRWTMPPPLHTVGPPVTNIRNTSSPHWPGWLKSANRRLVPFNSFAEYAPEPNPEMKKGCVVRAQRRTTAHRLCRDGRRSTATAAPSPGRSLNRTRSAAS